MILARIVAIVGLTETTPIKEKGGGYCQAHSLGKMDSSAGVVEQASGNEQREEGYFHFHWV
jgi:hypothetical protein